MPRPGSTIDKDARRTRSDAEGDRCRACYRESGRASRRLVWQLRVDLRRADIEQGGWQTAVYKNRNAAERCGKGEHGSRRAGGRKTRPEDRDHRPRRNRSLKAGGVDNAAGRDRLRVCSGEAGGRQGRGDCDRALSKMHRHHCGPSRSDNRFIGLSARNMRADLETSALTMRPFLTKERSQD